MRRSPLKPRSAKREAAAAERRTFVAEVLARFPRCQFPRYILLSDRSKAIIRDCQSPSVDVHEPLTRARGGSITDAANAVALCRSHHDYVHNNPREATELGLLVPSWDR